MRRTVSEKKIKSEPTVIHHIPYPDAVTSHRSESTMNAIERDVFDRIFVTLFERNQRVR